MAGHSGAGLYIHVPFCSRVCPYCDFAVLSAGAERRTGYLDALELEMARWRSWDRPFDTLYLGGGTPSCLDDGQLEHLLAAARGHLPIANELWISVEANPEHLTLRRAGAWRALGVSTVSLGVQSFQRPTLQFLGRQHDPSCARRAVDILHAAGFHTVAIDLIYGIPGQSTASVLDDLAQAAALEVDHLSCYQLGVHAGTVFGKRADRGELRLPREERQARLFEMVHRQLAGAGYEAYEVSNFARGREHRSRHNQKYWHHVPYLGLGPSAHSFADGRRWWNRRKLRLWQRALAHGTSPVEGEEVLSGRELLLEHVMLGLRTSAGIDLGRLEHHFGVDLEQENRRLFGRWVEQGLALRDGPRLKLSLKGWAITDALAGQVII